MRTHDAMESFFKDNAARFSNETVLKYRQSLRQFFTFCPKEFDQVMSEDIRSWLSALKEAKQKPRTIRTRLVSLRSFYQYCFEEKFIRKNPTLNIALPQIDQSLPVYLETNEIAQLMEVAKEYPRDRTVFEILYDTGIRANELLNIKLSDIRWDTQQIWIRKGKGKKDRFVLFTAECAERIRNYLANRNIESPYLFANRHGKALSRAWLQKLFSCYHKKLYLEQRFTPHTMRHTFAAHLAEKDMPQSYIQELLGHVNINSTRIYTNLSAKTRKKQYDSFQ
ncbi:MAG: integrase [Peptococcaceae bacterium BICA1-7]|nr:MAG: integrase [Peptococcaceae bacterium BICA1-7]HBV96177.1 integrase [Desulfotomaculum sp.]